MPRVKEFINFNFTIYDYIKKIIINDNEFKGDEIKEVINYFPSSFIILTTESSKGSVGMWLTEIKS